MKKVHKAKAATAADKLKDHKCGNAPIVMLKRPAYTDRDGIEQPPLYEAGCLVCVDRSRANTEEEAVAKFNAGDYIKERAAA
jgi:hypothetical protein